MRRMFTSAALTAGFLLLMSTAAFAAEVSITDDGPDPERVEVDVREEIMWTNNTDQDVSLVGEQPNWESGAIAPGATFSIEITQEGTYQYSSEDGSFTGQIIVGDAGAGGGGDGSGDGSGGNGGGEEEPVDEQPTDSEAEGDAGGEEEPEEALPMTGIDVTVPGALSLLLVAIGVGLLVVTQPARLTRQ